jgi:hypothetical protein
VACSSVPLQRPVRVRDSRRVERESARAARVAETRIGHAAHSLLGFLLLFHIEAQDGVSNHDAVPVLEPAFFLDLSRVQKCRVRRAQIFNPIIALVITAHAAVVPAEERIVDDAITVFLPSQHERGLINDECAPESDPGEDDQKCLLSQRSRILELRRNRANLSFIVFQMRRA